MKKSNAVWMLPLAEMTEAQRDARWENDPHELPHTKEREAHARGEPSGVLQTRGGAFGFLQRAGKTPEQAFPNKPKARAKYQKWLKDNKKD